MRKISWSLLLTYCTFIVLANLLLLIKVAHDPDGWLEDLIKKLIYVGLSTRVD